MNIRNIFKKGMAAVISAAIVLGMMPGMSGNVTQVQAAGGDKTIAGLGTSVIANPTAPTDATSAWQGSYVYFGSYGGSPVKYRVLDNNTSVFGGTTMLLDCDSVLETRAFDKDGNANTGYTNANEWAGSDIRTYLNKTFLSSNFSKQDQNAIASSTVASHVLTTDGEGGVKVAGWTKDVFKNYVALDNDKVFLLDAEDVSNGAYGYSVTDANAQNRVKTNAGGNAAYWWLRSAYAYISDFAGFVSSDGILISSSVDNLDVGVSPALNINLSSVLFTSVISGTAGDTGAEYKLTLLDSDMTVAGNGDITRNGDTVTVPYTITGANSGNATQVSILITDKAYTDRDAQILYYGALDTSAGNGTGTFTLSPNLSDKVCGSDYYAYIIAEDVNGEKETDYASTPVSITVPAYEAAGITGAPTANPTTGTYTENQSVTLTSSTEGAKIYYTTDGSVPTLTEGVPGGTTQEYTAPIAVTGTEGQSITTVIKAMAVKSGMQDSSVETFTYTIQLPVSKYTITATAGANGTISPSGAVKVTVGGSQTFTISPSSGYVIDTLKVDGLEVTAATGYTFSDVNANHTIEVTFKQESRTPNPVNYDILDGANSSWTQNTDGSLSIRGSGAFSKFVGVKVDGTLVDGKNYTIKEGSTIITLKTDYLNTLSVGTHTFEILWTDGSAGTTFTVVKNTSDSDKDNNNTAQTTDAKKDDVPKTGDSSNPVLWLTLLIVSMAGFTGTLVKNRRKDCD